MVFCDPKKAAAFATNHGDPIHILFKPVVQKDGSILLEEAGKVNTDEIIKSHEMETDIQYIISKFNAGDLSALDQKIGQYGDFTGMPKSYAEFLQLQIDSKRAFDALPLEAKKRFDMDPNKFLATAGEKEWFENLTDPNKVVDQVEKESEQVES